MADKIRKGKVASQDKKRLSAVNSLKGPQVTLCTSKKLRDSPICWCLLAVMRVVLSVYQTGYIHPDEFHQTLQVRARDIFDIDAQIPWEYTETHPIRSITFAGLVGLPYTLMKLAAPYASKVLGIELLTPNLLLVAPRLFMTIASFAADFSVYHIAKMCYVRPWQCMEVFAGSYVTLVYCTRTFSNTVEFILMSILLWRVCVSMVDSTKLIRKENILQDLYETSETMQERVKFARCKSKLPPYNYVDSFVISVLVTYGVFVRPTFIVYSFVPLAYWLQRGVSTREVDFHYFNMRCLCLLPGVIVSFVTCVLIDSFYYERITLMELLQGNVTANSFVVAPLNFIIYNSKTDNLMKHGLHPHYVHVFVNIPLLHGVLGLAGLWSVSKYLATLFFNKMSKKPKVYSLATMLLASFIVPVLLLSTIPHQEARFLLPTFIPLVLLHSDKVSLYAIQKLRFTKHFLFLMWHSWNMFCVIFFGFLHQGGVTKAMIQVHHYITHTPHSSDIHVAFSHMYTPPTFLLMRKMTVVTVTEEGRKYKVPSRVVAHHLSGGNTMESLHASLSELVEMANKTSSRDFELILCLPASLTNELQTTKPNNVSISLIRRLPCHVSLETLPQFNITRGHFNQTCGEKCSFVPPLQQFSMDVLRIDFTSTFRFSQHEGSHRGSAMNEQSDFESYNHIKQAHERDEF